MLPYALQGIGPGKSAVWAGLFALLSPSLATANAGNDQIVLIVSTAVGASDSAIARAPCWDEAPPDAKVLCRPETPEHAGTIGIRLTTSNGQPAEGRITADYATFEITATSPGDYIHRQSMLVIEDGEVGSQIEQITLLDDNVAEETETFGVRVTNFVAPPQYSLTYDHSIETILDNDRETTFFDLSASPSIISEDEGATSVEVTATADGNVLDTQTTITVSVSGSGANIAVAFEPVSDFTITVPANERSGSARFTLTPVDDEVLQVSETVVLAGTVPGLAVNGTTLRLVDHEVLTFAVADASGPEDGPPLAFEVSLGVEVVLPTEVVYQTEARTATYFWDYEVTVGVLTFAPGEKSKTVNVRLIDDSLYEDDEKFDLALLYTSIGGISYHRLQVSGTGTIIDDDKPPVIQAVHASANEGDQLLFEVKLEGESELPALVEYATSDGTATEGDDYLPAAGTLTFSPGEQSHTITVSTINDDIVEGREDVALTLLRAEDATLDPSSREAVGTIIDDDTVSLTVADAAAVEDGAALAFRVTLSPSSPLAVTADFATSDTTAIAGEDYEAASGTLTFPAGTTSATVLVEVLDDSIYEEEETLTLAFSNAANADAPDKPATGTIRDDDDPPDIVVDPASALEGEGPLAFTVRLTETSGAQATVSYRTSPGSASAGSDYTPVSGNLTFEPGDTRRTIEVALLDDDVDEADETFSVTLTAANGATLGRSTAQGTIRDDDLPAVSVRALTASVVEGAPATFEVTVAGIAAPATGVRVRLTGIGGFLVSGPTTRTIAFVAGSKTARLVAPTEDDARDEPDGEVTATLVAGSGYRIGTPSSATAAVLDNDQRAVLVQPTALAVVEGAQSSYTIGLASEPSGEVAVAVTVPGSTDVSVAPAAVTFTAIDWQTPRRITVSAAEDDDILADAPVRLAHAAKGADYDGTTGDSVTVTVVENDSAAFWIGDVSAAESDGMLRFVVSLSVASPATATVDYATMDGSATADSDYRATAGTLTFLPGETSKTVVVDLHDDDLHEADETLRVTLSNAVDAVIAKVAGTGTIADDDSAPVLAVGDAMAVESAGRISFPITMDGATGDNVTIAYATEDATAAAGADYLAASGSLTFASGEISKTVTVTLLDDSRYEADETFRMTLASPVNAVVDKDAGTGTITDDDEPPVLAVADMSASENAGTMAFEVTLREVAATRVAVDYATVDATALAGQDYSAAAGTLAFLPGETTRTIIVPLLDDALHEMDETFRVTLANPAGAIVADDEATGTITDDDEAATLSVGDQSAVESLGEIVFEISLAGQSAMPVTVEYATANGTANAQEDYEATTGTLTFDPGERSQTLTVPLLDDAVHEATETFQLELSSPFGANLAHGVGIGTITDDDPVPRLTARDATASEDAGELTFEIVMTGESDRPATVDYATSDDTALAAADYEAISGTLTFVPGESSKTIAVPLLDDEVHEADETLFLTLASPHGAVVDKDAGTGTITDDDEPPVLAVADMSASENAGTMAFEVTLREVAATRVAVDYATADATALAGQDYSATAGTLAFLPGETTRTIIVPLLDDALHEMDETFRVTLANPAGAIVADDEATGTITDDDEAATLSVGDQTAVESLGEIVFEISLAGQSAMPVTVEYATANGTANAQEDYEATTGTLTFDPGERSQTITVPLLDDAVHEATETFQLELSSPFGANLAHGVGIGTITDDDPVPRLTARDATASEDAGELTFEIVMTGESDRPATVDYATSDDTALAAADYEAISGTLTFVPGESSKTIAVPLLDDEVHEADETLFLTLASPDGATLPTAADADATGTITNDDGEPTLAVADATASEDVGKLAFVITMTGASDRPATVDYATSDGTATATQDYVATAGTLTFAPGEASKAIVVRVLGDALPEPDETLQMTLSNAAGAAVADGVGMGTILDDDETPPETARPIDDMVIALGTTRDLNLTPHFVGVPTSYSAQAANEAVGVSVDGAVLTVHGNAVGAAEVTVTAANGAGEATQTFTVTVVAPPTALRTLPQMALCVGGEPRSVDLATYFDGSSLRYSAMVSDPNTASVTLDGTTLAVAPRNEGVATVTVTAGNALGEASQVFGVTVVKDEAELAAAEAALAAVARSLLASIGDAVAERLRGSRRASRPAAQDLGPGHRYAHLAAARSNPFDEPTTDFDTGSGLAPDQGRQQLRRLPPFSLSVAAADAPSSTAYWVRGDWRRFESRDGDNQRDGTLGTLHLGIDRSFGRAVVGIAASLFAAQVDYRFERSSAACGTSLGKGLLETDLVGVHPYASWPIGRGKMWAFLGAGRGDVALRRCDSERGQETDLAMRMASLGGRWPLGRASTEGVAWSVVQDVGMVRLETGDHAGPLHKRSVTATRVRVGIEAIRSAGSARPFLSVMARHDGGDGETGGGLEVAGGLRYEHPVRRLEITAEGRALAVHSAQVRREFGIALSAMVPPRTDLTGFSLKVKSRFGADARRSNPLWGNAMPWDTPSRQALARQGWTMGWDIGYGFRTHAGVATPFVELDAGPTGRAAALGTRYRFAAGPDQIDIELSGGVEERLGGVHTHIAIRAALHF